MKKQFLSSVICLLTAIIWGFAFSAQDIASRNAHLIDAYFFNGIRFALGAVSLVPIILILDRTPHMDEKKMKNTFVFGVITGTVLFVASALQQFGIQMTGESGKAGFITSFYIILVPIISFAFFRQRISPLAISSMFFALVGLYFLFVGDSGISAVKSGDILVFVGTFFWAGHIIIVDRFIGHVNALRYSSVQFMTVAVLNIIFGIMFGTVTWEGIGLTAFPILYCGLASTGIAYTCQMIGQKNTPPAVAALLFSTEGVFSVIAECIFERRLPTTSMIIGCALMFAGIILSQIPPELLPKRKTKKSIQ